MAGNPNYGQILATSLAAHSKETADNVTKNNAVLAQLNKRGRVRTFDGGYKIVEPLDYTENANGGYFSGYDVLPTANAEVLTAAEYAIKQYAVGVVMSGLEGIQNGGKAQIVDLLAGKVRNAQATMANQIAQGIYSDGTGSGGKAITGLDIAVPQDPTVGTYGGINRATAGNEWWRSQLVDPAVTPTSATIQASMNALWAKCVRGTDRPDLILAGSTIWATFLASLQVLQQFTSAAVGELGFPALKYMGADVVLDGGVGGFATSTDMYFLNTMKIRWRPHSGTNMVPLGQKERSAYNQDATSQFLGFAGNLCGSGMQYCGRLKGD